MEHLFEKANILIPEKGIDMQKWSVIACDQHTSEPEYWDSLGRYIGNAPSTLHMMLPEAYLDREISYATINNTMSEYLANGVFREIKDALIYVERTLPNGKVRKGLVGAVNLHEEILATEDIVESRLPARVSIRKAAPLELPHILVFCQEDIFSSVKLGELVYDFDLNSDGGHIRGYLADADLSILSKLAIGDGNHSLAAAKKCGDHYALAELLDINDPAVEFYPIHRVLFDTDTSFLDEKIMHMDDVAECESFCKDYVAKHGGYIDYIHDDETAIAMGSAERCAAVLLPAFDKTKLFDDIESFGPYPKKSFSIGHSSDKRYYLECRKIND